MVMYAFVSRFQGKSSLFFFGIPCELMSLKFAYRSRGLQIGLLRFKPRDQNPERAKGKQGKEKKNEKEKVRNN